MAQQRLILSMHLLMSSSTFSKQILCAHKNYTPQKNALFVQRKEIIIPPGSSLTFTANDAADLLTLDNQVGFTDDTSFGAGGTTVFVNGNGTVIYNGTTNYPGTIVINNANFQVNGTISTASISVCRNIGFSTQRGTLSGTGTLTGNVFVNSGTISPSTIGTLTLGSLSLSSANPLNNTLGSLVHTEINGN